MKKFSLSKIWLVLALTLVAVSAVLIPVISLNKYNNSSIEFIDDGYILAASNDVETDAINQQYYFNGGTKYRETYDNKVVFEDTNGNKVSTENTNFLHYQDGSMNGLSSSVLLDTDKIEKTNDNGNAESNATINSYYSLSTKSILQKSGNKYVLSNAGTPLNITNFLWKISSDRYMVVSPTVNLVVSETSSQTFDDYVELRYIDEGVVHLVSQAGTYSTISSDAYLELENGIRVYIGSKNVSDDEQILMNLSQMIVDSNDNIEVIPDEEYRKENDAQPQIVVNATDGAKGEVGEAGESGENGDNGDNGSPGVSGNQGGDGDNGKAGLNADVAYTPDKTPIFYDIELDPSAYGVDIDMKYDDNGCFVDSVWLSIVKDSSGLEVWKFPLNSDYLGSNIKIDGRCKTLEQETAYTFIVNATYSPTSTSATSTDLFTQALAKATFMTDPIGLQLDLSYATANSLVLRLTKNSDTDFVDLDYTPLQIELYDDQKKEFTTPVYGVPANSNIYSFDAETGKFKISDLESDENHLFVGDYIDISFDNLEPNTTYFAQIHIPGEDGSISLVPTSTFAKQEFKTLKREPYVGRPSGTYNSTINAFTVLPGTIQDYDNGIISYTYEIYEYLGTDSNNNVKLNDLVYSTTRNSGSNINVSVADPIKRGNEHKYVARMIVEFDNNNNIIKVPSEYSEPFFASGDSWPIGIMSQNSSHNTGSTIEQTITINDASHVIGSKTETYQDDAIMTLILNPTKLSTGEITKEKEIYKGSLGMPIEKPDGAWEFTKDFAIQGLAEDTNYSVSLYISPLTIDGITHLDDELIGTYNIRTKVYSPLLVTHNQDTNDTKNQFKVNVNFKSGGETVPADDDFVSTLIDSNAADKSLRDFSGKSMSYIRFDLYQSHKENGKDVPTTNQNFTFTYRYTDQYGDEKTEQRSTSSPIIASAVYKDPSLFNEEYESGDKTQYKYNFNFNSELFNKYYYTGNGDSPIDSIILTENDFVFPDSYDYFEELKEEDDAANCYYCYSTDDNAHLLIYEAANNRYYYTQGASKNYVDVKDAIIHSVKYDSEQNKYSYKLDENGTIKFIDDGSFVYESTTSIKHKLSYDDFVKKYYYSDGGVTVYVSEADIQHFAGPVEQAFLNMPTNTILYVKATVCDYVYGAGGDYAEYGDEQHLVNDIQVGTLGMFSASDPENDQWFMVSKKGAMPKVPQVNYPKSVGPFTASTLNGVLIQTPTYYDDRLTNLPKEAPYMDTNGHYAPYLIDMVSDLTNSAVVGLTFRGPSELGPYIKYQEQNALGEYVDVNGVRYTVFYKDGSGNEVDVASSDWIYYAYDFDDLPEYTFFLNVPGIDGRKIERGRTFYVKTEVKLQFNTLTTISDPIYPTDYVGSAYESDITYQVDGVDRIWDEIIYTQETYKADPVIYSLIYDGNKNDKDILYFDIADSDNALNKNAQGIPKLYVIDERIPDEPEADYVYPSDTIKASFGGKTVYLIEIEIAQPSIPTMKVYDDEGNPITNKHLIGAKCELPETGYVYALYKKTNSGSNYFAIQLDTQEKIYENKKIIMLGDDPMFDITKKDENLPNVCRPVAYSALINDPLHPENLASVKLDSVGQNATVTFNFESVDTIKVEATDNDGHVLNVNGGIYNPYAVPYIEKKYVEKEIYGYSNDKTRLLAVELTFTGTDNLGNQIVDPESNEPIIITKNIVYKNVEGSDFYISSYNEELKDKNGNFIDVEGNIWTDESTLEKQKVYYFTGNVNLSVTELSDIIGDGYTIQCNVNLLYDNGQFGYKNALKTTGNDYYILEKLTNNGSGHGLTDVQYPSLAYATHDLSNSKATYLYRTVEDTKLVLHENASSNTLVFYSDVANNISDMQFAYNQHGALNPYSSTGENIIVKGVNKVSSSITTDKIKYAIPTIYNISINAGYSTVVLGFNMSKDHTISKDKQLTIEYSTSLSDFYDTTLVSGDSLNDKEKVSAEDTDRTVYAFDWNNNQSWEEVLGKANSTIEILPDTDYYFCIFGYVKKSDGSYEKKALMSPKEISDANNLISTISEFEHHVNIDSLVLSNTSKSRDSKTLTYTFNMINVNKEDINKSLEGVKLYLVKEDPEGNEKFVINGKDFTGTIIDEPVSTSANPYTFKKNTGDAKTGLIDAFNNQNKGKQKGDIVLKKEFNFGPQTDLEHEVPNTYYVISEYVYTSLSATIEAQKDVSLSKLGLSINEYNASSINTSTNILKEYSGFTNDPNKDCYISFSISGRDINRLIPVDGTNNISFIAELEMISNTGTSLGTAIYCNPEGKAIDKDGNLIVDEDNNLLEDKDYTYQRQLVTLTIGTDGKFKTTESTIVNFPHVRANSFYKLNLYYLADTKNIAIGSINSEAASISGNLETFKTDITTKSGPIYNSDATVGNQHHYFDVDENKVLYKPYLHFVSSYNAKTASSTDTSISGVKKLTLTDTGATFLVSGLNLQNIKKIEYDWYDSDNTIIGSSAITTNNWKKDTTADNFYELTINCNNDPATSSLVVIYFYDDPNASFPIDSVQVELK